MHTKHVYNKCKVKCIYNTTLNKVALVFASTGEPLKPLALIWQALTAV